VRLDEATRWSAKPCKSSRRTARTSTSLGWVYYRQNRLEEAPIIAARVAQIGKDPTVHDHLGDVYSSRQVREAIGAVAKSMKEYEANMRRRDVTLVKWPR